MSTCLKALPNTFSLLRIAIVPALWVLALEGRTTWVGVGLLVAGATDMVDGNLARRLDAVSELGARLDSLADNLLALSGAAWLLMLRPDVVWAHATLFVAWFGIYLVFLAVGLLKFGRLANLHLWSGKLAAVFLYAFLLHCMLVPGMPDGLFYVTMAISVASLTEGLAYELLSERVHEHAGSLLWLLLRRSAGAT